MIKNKIYKITDESFEIVAKVKFSPENDGYFETKDMLHISGKTGNSMIDRGWVPDDLEHCEFIEITKETNPEYFL